MVLSMKRSHLLDYVKDQLNTFFPDGAEIQMNANCIDESLERLDKCFKAVADKRFWRVSDTYFDHLHSDQYAMFLYLLSNAINREKANQHLCDKLFLLNKTLYGIDVFYEVELPQVFLFCHASGTVLGRAKYSDNFLVYQQCTIGSARAAEGAGRGVFPVLGKHISLYVGASVLGACHLGDNCKVSAHSVVMNKRLKPNTVYRGTPQSYETVTFPFPDNVWK